MRYPPIVYVLVSVLAIGTIICAAEFGDTGAHRSAVTTRP